MRFPWGWPQLPAWAVVALAGQWQQLSGCRQVSCSCLMSLFGAPRELLLSSHPCCVCNGWLNAPAKPCSTYQRGDSSPTGAEGTSSEVNQASLKKHLKHLKIPNIRCFFFFYSGHRLGWLAPSPARCSAQARACPCCPGGLSSATQALGCPQDSTMKPGTTRPPKCFSLLFYPQDCLLCAASSIKCSWSTVDGDSYLRSMLSSTVSLLTPAVAASWGLMVSCIHF